MADSANLLEFPPPPPHPEAWKHERSQQPARLIPGIDSCVRGNTRRESLSEKHGAYAGPTPALCRRFLTALLPSVKTQFHPAMLGMLAADLFLICGAFRIAAKAIGINVSLPSIAGLACFFLLFATHESLYDATNNSWDLWPVVKVVFWTVMTTALTIDLRTGPVKFLILVAVIACALTMARCLRKSLSLASPLRVRNVLAIADLLSAQNIANAIAADLGSCRRLKAFLPPPRLVGEHSDAILRTIARQECVDEVIVACSDLELTNRIIRWGKQNHLDVSVAPQFEKIEGLVLESVAGLPLLKVHQHKFPEWHLAAKRFLDVLLATIALLVASPLLIVIAVAIKLDSPGPAIYRSLRIGRKGHRFLCYKFRTMRLHADAEKAHLRLRNERAGAFFKIVQDPRITRIGRFLRRFSLDELPQLWNVLRGEMSLVGPRPHPPDDVERYSLDDLQRLDFVPGMTGLWQVTARKEPSFELCVALDVAYIRNWSFWLDVRILCKTVLAVLQGSGA